MADLGEEAYSSQMKVIATFLRLLEELMRNKQQDLRYGTKTQRRGIFRRMKDFVGGVFKKVYDGTFGRLSRNGKDYGQLDLNDPAVAKLFADTMKQMGMDTMHEDNNLLFSTSDIAKIMAFSKMVEQELGKKIEHENDTPEKEQSQEHGQDHEKQADARDWSDYPATPEQIELTATVLAADEGVSIDEIKKDFSENPSIGELQIALEAKGHDTMAIQPDLRNYATPEQRAQLDMLKDKGVIGEDELSPLDKKYLIFGNAFEREFVGQGPMENRTITETLDIGWKLLGLLPKEELDRIDTKVLNQYYQPTDIDLVEQAVSDAQSMME